MPVPTKTSKRQCSNYYQAARTLTMEEDDNIVRASLLGDVFGFQIHMPASITHDILSRPCIPHKPTTTFVDDDFATLMPSGSECVGIHIQNRDTVYFHHHNTPHTLFMSKYHFTILGRLFPEDTSIVGFVFQQKGHDRVTLGIFDVLRFQGETMLECTALQRHSLLHENAKAKQFPSHVQIHWCGYAKTCYNIFRNSSSLPFVTNSMIVISNTYRKVLSPINTSFERKG